jgi:hypothetical protein
MDDVVSPQANVKVSADRTGRVFLLNMRLTERSTEPACTVTLGGVRVLPGRCTEVSSVVHCAVHEACVVTVPVRTSLRAVLTDVTLSAVDVIASMGAFAAPVLITIDADALRVASNTVTVTIAEVPLARKPAVNVI